MRTARFRHLLDAHGPELTQWPAELAGAARKLVLRDASAAQELEAAQRLERLLAGHLRSEPNHGGRALSEGDTVSMSGGELNQLLDGFDVWAQGHRELPLKRVG